MFPTIYTKILVLICFVKIVFTFLFIVKIFFQIIVPLADLYIFTTNLTSSLLTTADQTHCHICKRHLQKGGIWCVICKTYIPVSCSGLQSSTFYYDGLSCIQSNPKNIARGSNFTSRPPGTTPISTQKETSSATPETNVLPNATQSNPSPPAITTVLSDPWKLIDLSNMNLNLK